MAGTNKYRRPALTHRPWIRAGLYDLYARKSVLHCDAFAIYLPESNALALVIDWREGGKVQIACDAYLIEPDGLTPLWDATGALARGTPVYWTRANNALMRRVHATVLAEADKARALESIGLGEATRRWARVAVQAHYVHVKELDGEAMLLKRPSR